MPVRRSILAVLLVLGVAPAWSSPGEVDIRASTSEAGSGSVGECGGFAPSSPSCSFTGNLPAASTVHLSGQLEFTGRIRIVLKTSTGEYMASCDFLGVFDPVCRSNTSGVLQIGQSFTLTATASAYNPHDRRDLGDAAVGRWRVSMTAN
ncbi:MAG TPA: hypothetical protein VM841_10305 [Actinomycetota bacterium]|nr:hypothetical protein [Actinomycetota bacterium]